MRDDLRQAATKMRGLKDVFENAPDVDPGPFVSVKTQRAMAKIQRSNVIETEDVVGVTMSHQHCVEMFQAMTQSLLAKIGRSVNDNDLARVFD
jgi:hypothetical protein